MFIVIRVPADFANLRAPPGYLMFESYLIICIYDSVVIFDTPANLTLWKARIEHNRISAHATFKYDTMQPLDVPFTFCGFELLVTPNGLRWRVAPELLTTWELPTPRTLWSLLGVLTFINTVLEVSPRFLGFARNLQSEMGLIADGHWDVVHEPIAPVFAECVQFFRKIKNVFRHSKSRKRHTQRLQRVEIRHRCHVESLGLVQS